MSGARKRNQYVQVHSLSVIKQNAFIKENEERELKRSRVHGFRQMRSKNALVRDIGAKKVNRYLRSKYKLEEQYGNGCFSRAFRLIDKNTCEVIQEQVMMTKAQAKEKNFKLKLTAYRWVPVLFDSKKKIKEAKYV